MLTGMGSTIATGKTIYVDTIRNGDGSSWANAYKYLQDALSAAISGDEIRVAEGIYTPDRNLANPGGSGLRTATFGLKIGVGIYGGFPTGGCAWGDRDPNVHKTILSGDIGMPYVNTDNSYHVVTGSYTNLTAVLDGFTITAGNANGISYSDYHGGGMYNYYGSPTVKNCTFSLNTVISPNAWTSGAGMYNYNSSSPTVSNCTFSQNTVVSDGAWSGGGGMSNGWFSSPTVSKCTFNANTVISEKEEWTGGAGMCNYYYSNSIVTDCNFNENTVISMSHLSGGGGIENYSSNTTIINCRFSGNSANNGGGIVNVLGFPTITDCMIIGNAANLSGGGVTNLNCSSTLSNCEFVGNSASFGGGMANTGQGINCSPKLINCTFSGNIAHFKGGGMYNGGLFHSIPTSLMLTDGAFSKNEVWESSVAMQVEYYTIPTLTNCTFSGNEALDFGGAIDSEYGSNPTLTNCILWGNKSAKGAQIAIKQNPDAGPSNLAISYSDVQGGQADVYIEGECTLEWDNESMISNDPLFLDADGLDNKIGTEDDNLRLLFSSPCIDAGDNEADTDANTPGVQVLPVVDLDGGPRFIEDPNVPNTGNGTPPIVDMGAYEGARGTILIVLSAESVTVPEGQTATFDVNLGMDPQGTVDVVVAHESGDSDINVVSGSSLTFNSSNYWNPQTVTLAASEDGDYLFGTALISVVVPGVVGRSLTVVELDNEPAPSVLFVDGQAPGTNNGSSWTNAFRDLQAALEIAGYAVEVEEIRVAAGTYKPAGPLGERIATFELLSGVAIYGGFPSGGGAWQDRDPNIHETILSGDLNGNDVADANNGDNSYHVVTASGTEPNTILDGFTITAGNASGWTPHNLGAGMFNHNGSPVVVNCVFSGNSAVFCGGMYNYGGSPTITNCTFIDNSVEAWGGGMYNYETSATLTNCTFSLNSSKGFLGRYGGGMCSESSNIILNGVTLISGNNPDGVWMGYGSVQINGTVQIVDNNWLGDNLMFNGDGTLQIDPCSTLDLADASIRCDLSGTGTVHVALGSELIIESDAIIDLGHESDPNITGTIKCEGLLHVRDSVHLRNAEIDVERASFEGGAIISNNVITAEAGAPYGQFFIEDTVKITGNDIHANGDRYMDLDPSVFAGVIANNRIFVTITEGVGNTHGGLLELRGSAGLATISSCDPNNEFFCEVNDVPVFDTNSWRVERLELVAGAKVNLTNRFDFGNGDPCGLYEVMYVKELILGPNSMLNTAFNQFYFEDINKAQTAVIRNEPILGFSLSNIAFDNEIEFMTRVMHNNFEDPDPEAPDYSRIHVERVEGSAPDPNGMMRMSNLQELDPCSPNYGQVINARAKGLFAKASEDEVLILFEYLFGTSDSNVQLVIYLTDVPELLDHNDPCRLDHYIEVARLYPPPPGQYGSVGSGHFGVFEENVYAGDLDFIRGVRMEFELVGPKGTWILINNWDPLVSCVYCGDVTGDLLVSPRDYLSILSASGELSSGPSTLGLPLYCFDFGFSEDGFLDTTDLLGWDWEDWVDEEFPWIGNLCFDICLTPCDGSTPPLQPPVGGAFMFETTSTAALQAGGDTGFAGSLLISGKRFDFVNQDFLSDRLYDLDENYNLVGGPYAMDTDQMNGKLVRDHNDLLYQVNMEKGLVRVSAGFTVIIPRGYGYPVGPGYPVISEPRYGKTAGVYIGFQEHGENTWGRPFFDAAFDSNGDVYVTPVVVDPCLREPYVASAKLVLVPGQTPPYNVVEIYDDPPLPNSNQDCNNLREIEVDSSGNVYVINSGYNNNSDILWVYNNNGDLINKCELQNLGIYAPIGLYCSSYDNSRLYVASSKGEPDAASASLHILSTADLSLLQAITINNMGHITDITEDPFTGTLWVIGFQMPEYIDVLPLTIEQFYFPYLAAVPYGSSGSVDAEKLLNVSDLALPLSIAWVGDMPAKCGGADLDGMGDVSFGDLNILVSQWLQAGGTPSADIAPKPAGDGIVNFLDLAVLAGYWLQSCGL